MHSIHCQFKLQIHRRIPRLLQITHLRCLRLYTASTPSSTPDLNLTDKQKLELYYRVNWEKEDPKTSFWQKLSNAYNIPAENLYTIYKQTANSLLSDRKEKEKKVIESVKRNYTDSGEIVWSQVAKETRIPLIECLRLFSYEKDPAIVRRSSLDEWPNDMQLKLNRFVRHNFVSKARIDWSLVSKYFNISIGDCVDAYLKYTSTSSFSYKHKWTRDEISDLIRYRDALKLTWAEIVHKMQIPNTSISAYKTAYDKHRSLEATSTQTGYYSLNNFSSKERRNIYQIIKASSIQNCKDPRLIDIVAKEFPDKPRKSIERATKHIFNSYLQINIGYLSIVRLFYLVKVYGQDWDAIGRKMDEWPPRLEYNWHKNKRKFGTHTEKWTKEELIQFERLVNDGLGLTAIANMTPNKLLCQCQNMYAKIISNKKKQNVKS